MFRSFISASLLLGLLATTQASALEEGDRAPSFAAPSLTGEGTVELNKYRGKVVYLDFWASWCGPCLKAIPEIEDMRSDFPADDFQILAVNLDQKEKKALRFLKRIRSAIRARVIRRDACPDSSVSTRCRPHT